jgi:DNA-binding NtrC family response regulator
MKILIADDDFSARYALRKTLLSSNRTLLEAENGQQALDLILNDAVDLVFLDLNMPVLDGKGVLAELQRQPAPYIPEIIVVTANDTVSDAVECIRLGATDYITKPYEIDRMRSLTLRAERRVQLQLRLEDLQNQIEKQPELGGMDGMLGASRAIHQLFSKIIKAAATELPILVRGESGTGKELVAQSIHRRSPRASGPLVAINTAAISETLIESELFGHVKGAFTGADRDREGVFRQANHGTLFLDEIGDMPMRIQTRLLRVIQEGIVQPVGSEKSFPVDVRLISATHQDIEQGIGEKLFREDLYYRLKGIELLIPPLRQRQEDILLIANQFLPEGMMLSGEAVMSMIHYPWPGNVRELIQRVRAAAAMADSKTVNVSDLGLQSAATPEQSSGFDAFLDLPLSEGKTLLIDRFERAAVGRAIELENGNISAAARRLGMHRQSLQQKIKQLGMGNASSGNPEFE